MTPFDDSRTAAPRLDPPMTLLAGCLAGRSPSWSRLRADQPSPAPGGVRRPWPRCPGAPRRALDGRAIGQPAPTPLIVPPAPLKADPVSLAVAWLFNPIFQGCSSSCVGIDQAERRGHGHRDHHHDALVRTALVPLMRRSMCLDAAHPAVAPEVKEIQRRYKGDRAKPQQATWTCTRSAASARPAACRCVLLFILLIPMYKVFREGSRTSTRRDARRCSASSWSP